eukprot:COSAG01_NODE_29799_length_629_cov_1.120755_1_plen_96_part_00
MDELLAEFKRDDERRALAEQRQLQCNAAGAEVGPAGAPSYEIEATQERGDGDDDDGDDDAVVAYIADAVVAFDDELEALRLGGPGALREHALQEA